MSLTRRAFLNNLAAGGVAVSCLGTASIALAGTKTKVKAIAFDAFPILDPRPVSALAEKLFPDRGTELSNTWRTRQFEYCWLRLLSQRYANFWKVTEDALIFSARMLKLDLTAEKRTQLMNEYLKLRTWPDVLPALKSLKAAGMRLAFLSNFTPEMLQAGIKNSGLDGMFEFVISTDTAKTYKPAVRAYELGIDNFGLKRDEILFAPSAGWDAAGAKAFGYPTFWVNRLKLPVEQLDITPDAIGENLTDLTDFLEV